MDAPFLLSSTVLVNPPHSRNSRAENRRKKKLGLVPTLASSSSEVGLHVAAVTRHGRCVSGWVLLLGARSFLLPFFLFLLLEGHRHRRRGRRAGTGGRGEVGVEVDPLSLLDLHQQLTVLGTRERGLVTVRWPRNGGVSGLSGHPARVWMGRGRKGTLRPSSAL